MNNFRAVMEEGVVRAFPLFEQRLRPVVKHHRSAVEVTVNIHRTWPMVTVRWQGFGNSPQVKVKGADAFMDYTFHEAWCFAEALRVASVIIEYIEQWQHHTYGPEYMRNWRETKRN